MKRIFLTMLLCLMLPAAALADTAAEDMLIYQVEPANGMVYADWLLPAGSEYCLIARCFPEEGTALADFFVTTGPISWGRIVWGEGDTGLIVLNPEVVVGERTYTELEAAEAERRYAAYGNAYRFEPIGEDILYYVNLSGGQFYHLDMNCITTADYARDMLAAIAPGQLSEAPYSRFARCRYCFGWIDGSPVTNAVPEPFPACR